MAKKTYVMHMNAEQTAKKMEHDRRKGQWIIAIIVLIFGIGLEPLLTSLALIAAAIIIAPVIKIDNGIRALIAVALIVVSLIAYHPKDKVSDASKTDGSQTSTTQEVTENAES